MHDQVNTQVLKRHLLVTRHNFIDIQRKGPDHNLCLNRKANNPMAIAGCIKEDREYQRLSFKNSLGMEDDTEIQGYYPIEYLYCANSQGLPHHIIIRGRYLKGQLFNIIENKIYHFYPKDPNPQMNTRLKTRWDKQKLTINLKKLLEGRTILYSDVYPNL